MRLKDVRSELSTYLRENQSGRENTKYEDSEAGVYLVFLKRSTEVKVPGAERRGENGSR